MIGKFLFKRWRRNSSFDIYIVLGILFIAVVYSHPPKMWEYIIAILLTVILLIFIEKLKIEDSKQSFINYTMNVPSEFVKDHSTLGNIHCMAKYFPSQNKIVVMDHPDSREKSELRLFEVSRENVGNVSKVWQDICSVFDEYTFFDTLFSYIDKNSGVLKLNYIYRTSDNRADKQNIEDEVHEFVQPEPVYAPEALVLSEYGDPLINIEKLDKKTSTNDTDYDTYEDFVEMDEILKPEEGKIDVNIANADKLAELPGINIVRAKKVIEHRNKNGFYKTKEDFYNAAGVKEHFKAQLDDIITVDKTSKVIVENPRKIINERIVD